MTASTYRAVQATAPGQLELVELPIQEPPAGHVRIRVEACGVCHSDAATVEGVMPVEYPRVPGHELVGRIEALGEGVSGWELGQRVGVGFLGGHCNVCAFCRRGDFVNCTNQGWTGVHSDGGYAEVMIAKQTALAAIPEDLESVEAAPLLCAGLTTFEGLRDSGVRPGELVAVLGVGGLGHLGIQYARSMGLRVAAIARGEEKRALAEQLGAHHYIDSSATDPAVALQELGGAALVLATAANGDAMSATLGGLRPHGRLIVLGVPSDPLQVAAPQLIFGERAIVGSLTGSAQDAQDTLDYSVLQDVRAMVTTFPLADAAAAYGDMLAGKARFRNVLVM